MVLLTQHNGSRAAVAKLFETILHVHAVVKSIIHVKSPEYGLYRGRFRRPSVRNHHELDGSILCRNRKFNLKLALRRALIIMIRSLSTQQSVTIVTVVLPRPPLRADHGKFFRI